MAISASAIHDWSVAAFNQFYPKWNFQEFWTRANTFDACLCFLMAAINKWPDDKAIVGLMNDANNLITANLSYFNQNLSGDTLWVDDFGWCGNASLTAINYLSTNGGDGAVADQYLEIAAACAKNLQNTGYDAGGMPIPGGYRNSSQQDRTDGVKNTVTNASTFLLYSRLTGASVGKNYPWQDYLVNAYGQYCWFAAWFASQYDYFHTFGDGFRGLVQERPIAPPDYERKDHPPWEPGWVWTGDQGLLMAGFREFARILENQTIADYFKASWPAVDLDNLKQDLGAKVSSMALGIAGMLCDKNYVLQEAPFSSSFGSAYAGAYVAGKGVLMRYLAQVRDVLTFYPSTEICASATMAWNNSDQSTHQFGAVWNPSAQMDFQNTFTQLWGLGGDPDKTWDFSETNSQVLLPILQAAGLDVLGAAIPLSQ